MKRKAVKTVISALLMISLFIGSVNVTVFSENDTQEEESIITEPQNIQSAISLPDNLRAAVITPSVDFPTTDDENELTINSKLDSIYTKMTDIGLNGVVINTVYEDKAYYINEINESVKIDYVELAYKKAKEYNLKVFLMFDVSYVISHNTSGKDDIDNLISEVHKFTLKYMSDGIILDNYYSIMTTESFNNYMHNGSGIGYENWLYERTDYFIKTLASIVHITDNTIPVGLNITDVWANSADNAAGSDTTAEIQALYDGFADTKAVIERGIVDFAFVHSVGSMTDADSPYEAVTTWWEDICSSSSVNMYIIHHNEYLGITGHDGWYAEDQLLQQLSVSKDKPGYCGSVFNSFASLDENTVNSATTLKAFYQDEINEETLFDELKITLPQKNNYTTGDSSVVFAGTFDENFEVFLNGNRIKLNEAGNFYIEQPLEVGTNNFTITHKSKSYYFVIERKVNVIKSIDDSIQEGKALKVDGGTKISVSAIAYKGAKVTASLGTQTVTLTERSAALEGDELNSSYAQFKGTLTVPEGIAGTEQSLGQITITATLDVYSKTMLGANVYINPAAKTSHDKIDSIIYENQDSLGTGEIVGTMDYVHGEDEAVSYIRTNSDYTFVYDGKTTGSILTPNFSQLPASTLDYYKSTSGSFYISESGRRYSNDVVSVVDGTGLGENNLVVKSIGTSGGDSYIRMTLDDHVTYNVEVVGNNYYSGLEGDYYLDNFTATHVYITFDNLTSVTKLPSFKYNLVFSSGKWDTVTVNGVPKFRLVLKLRQDAVYAGNGAHYNSDGDLMLTFEVLQNSLSAMNIVIDPGHGYGRSAEIFDPGAVGHVVEQEVNLAVAEKLTEKLKALGCNAVRLKTESTYLLTVLRPGYARQYGCDLYISLHANQTNSDARGVEVYFFTSFSQPVAAAISSNIASYFSQYVYSDGANKNRGAKYSYFWVTEHHDFPSVLVEMGFVSNYEDAMAMGNPVHQDGIAQAIVNGIIEYISRSNITYTEDGEDGTDDVPVTTAPQTTPPEITTTPETTDAPLTTIPEMSFVPETTRYEQSL